MPLNAKQQRFTEEYLVDFNGTQAAIRAGYSAKTAGSQAFDLLKKPEIKKIIDDGKKKAGEAALDLKAKVLREYERIAFFDPRKLHSDDGNLKHILDLDDDTAAGIAGVEVYVERTTRKGKPDESGDADNVQEISKTHKIKFADKKGALDSLGKHLGIFNGNDDANATDSMPFVKTEQNMLALAVKLAFILSRGVAAKESGTVLSPPTINATKADKPKAS